MRRMIDFGHAPHSVKLGDLEVRRLGYGAMRLPGPEVWGPPADRERAKKVLKRAIDLGVNLIDTAWYYGPHVSNELIAEALHPYPRDLVIATKLGGKRSDDKGWRPHARPNELREGLEIDLKSLKLERVDVCHFRYIAMAGVPFLESWGALVEEQKKGRIRHLALSNVSAKEIELALAHAPVVSVSNMFTIAGGGGPMAKMAHAEVDDPDGVLALCEKRGIAYLPFFPLAVGKHDEIKPALRDIAKKRGVTTAQIALAYLLARSPVMLPIPGTSSVEHLEENWAARTIALSPDEIAAIAS
jgi:aryl-alcohol dehydrogenase-like predicted oxidoreductase